MLDHASRHATGEIVVYWVVGGLPEIFCINMGRIFGIAFHERYVLLTSLLRRLMLDPVSEHSIREELAERVFLKFMAEFALQQNQGQLAAQAFMKALAGQRVFLSDAGGLLALETHTRNEAYMAMWFYGLLHEVGHIAVRPDFFETGALSDANVHGAVARVLADLPYSSAYKQAILLAARTDPEHILSSSRLRSEGLADAFAATMLLETSIQVLGRAGQEFAIDRFLMEQFMMLKIISSLQTCRLCVQAAVNSTPEAQQRLLLHEIAMAVRGMIVIEHLKHTILPFIRGWLDKTRLRRSAKLLDAVVGMLQTDTGIIDKGMHAAISFVLSWRALEPALLKAFSAEVKDNLMHKMDGRSFLALADSYGTRSPGLDAIRGVLP